MHEPTQGFRDAIMATLGHVPELIEPGRFHRFATSNRRGDSAGWCKLFDDMHGGVFGCYRQGISETWSAADRATLTRQQRAELAQQVAAATVEREAQQRNQWTENARRIAHVWAQCVPLRVADPVTLYLKRRLGAAVWPLPQCLRFHPALPYWDGAQKLGTFPAMVAPIIAPDGRIAALHRTYLTADGRKADVPTVKKLTGAAGPLAGASIPLHAPAHGVIGVAEGIETALAAWIASGVPTVAAYCAGAVAGYLWPVGVQRLVIFADADKAGREAADALRARALAARLRCDVLTPATEGTDWADVWAARDAVLIESERAA
jgi:putative DNA primase/helicase